MLSPKQAAREPREFDAFSDDCHKCGSLEWTEKGPEGCNLCAKQVQAVTTRTAAPALLSSGGPQEAELAVSELIRYAEGLRAWQKNELTPEQESWWGCAPGATQGICQSLAKLAALSPALRNGLEALALRLTRAAPVSTSLGGGAAEKVQAIKARLAAAPGLPWAVDEQVQQIYSPSTGNYIGTEGTIADPEIAFIINASEDIKYLLSLLPEAADQLLVDSSGAGSEGEAEDTPTPGLSYCMGVDLEGLLINGKKHYKGLVSDDNDNVLSPRDTRAWLVDQLRKGHRVVPMGECDNWNYAKGRCMGHPADHD